MKSFNYNRAEIKAGIVHFGVGNFHRAHLEAYTNRLLEDPSQRGWGVFGAMIMPTDEELFRALKKDDGIYRLTTCSPSGHRNSQWIGSLVGLAWGEQDSDAIISRIASEEIKIISLTITESGYEVDLDKPRSVFWYVAEGLTRRMEKDLPLTILSCDNMRMNGDTARKAFMTYFEAKYPRVVAWVEKRLSFPEFHGGSDYARNPIGVYYRRVLRRLHPVGDRGSLHGGSSGLGEGGGYLHPGRGSV